MKREGGSREGENSLGNLFVFLFLFFLNDKTFCIVRFRITKIINSQINQRSS